MKFLGDRRLGETAFGMPESARALGVTLHVFGNIEDHVVRARAVHAGRNMVQPQNVANLPGDDVIRA